tara:strand:+ start:2037 stop:2510 length:474 start_codon:yes stop_codon:yes gene_type:complete
MKKVTTREFVRKFGSLKGETFIVMDRKKPIGTYTPYDEKAKRMTNSEERMTNVTTSEEKPVVKKNKVVEMLRAQVREIENRGSELPPIPDIWHKEEEEEEKWIKCDVCKSGRAEKTFYDSGGAGEVEICRQCARMKYAGSMRTFDGYWRKLQDTNVY